MAHLAPLPRELRIFVGSFNLGNAPPDQAFVDHFAALARDYDIVAIGAQEAHYGMAPPLLDPDEVTARLYGANASSADDSATLLARAAQWGGVLGGALLGGVLLAPVLPLAVLGAAAGAAAGGFAGAKAADALECRPHFFRIAAAALGPPGAYVAVATEALLQMRLAVFAKAEVYSHLSAVRAWSVGAGPAGLPNKGGIGLSLRVANTRLAFVACHLAPHEGEKQRLARHAMLSDVLRGGAEGGDTESSSVVARHDHVFVFGDLNYRLDAAALLASAAAASGAEDRGDDAAAEAPLLPPDASPRAALRDAAAAAAAAVGLGAAEAGAAAAEARDAAWRTAVAAVTSHRLEALSHADELTRSMQQGEVLPGFREGDVAAFAPTFKLEAPLSGAKGALQRAEACAAGTAPPRGYSAKRVPAWTDRVLWRSPQEGPSAANALRQSAYASCPAVATSDHTPVYAAFTLAMPQDQEQQD